MGNQDKIYQQFQQAAKNAESNPVPELDKIWARVEDKLDKKVLKNENRLWKKIAIAASFLLLLTLGYQFFKEDSEIIVPENSIVNDEVESIKTDNPIIEIDKQEMSPAVVNSEKTKEIIKEKIVTEQAVAIVENDALTTQNEVIEEAVAKSVETDKTEVVQNGKKEKSVGFFNAPIYVAKSVKSPFIKEQKQSDSLTDKQVIKKANPLLVVDGEAVVNRNNDSMETLLKKSTSHYEDVEIIKVLAEPLYIINGAEYSEEELFGKNPTSPYYPLDKQEIISTKILLEREAMAVYGEKGKKGVVIINTKNGKPLKK